MMRHHATDAAQFWAITLLCAAQAGRVAAAGQLGAGGLTCVTRRSVVYSSEHCTALAASLSRTASPVR